MRSNALATVPIAPLATRSRASITSGYAEAALPEHERMEFVAIVTPNHLHLPVARTALRAGFHVLSDKPATKSLDECRELAAEVESAHKLYGLTHAMPCRRHRLADRPAM